MKSQISCIWASDFSKNTGEGILGRLFVNKLIINNRTILNKNIGTKIYYIIKIYVMQLKMIIPVN